MTSTNKIFASAFICLLVGCCLPISESISLATFLLLRQQYVNAQRQQRGGGPSWGEWGQWSICTSTSEMGVRVRSRPCNGSESCERLPGDNYQVEMCNQRVGESRNQNAEYVRQCEDDPLMRNTLSCRLYTENPTMAYDIFQSTGCLFNAISDQSDQGDSMDSLVFGRPPNTRAGETSLLFQGDINTAPLSSGRFSERGVTPSAPPRTSQPLLTNYISALALNRFCEDTCERVVVRATGISSFGSSAPSTLSAIIQLVQTNAIFRDNSGSIRNEYDSCRSQCSILGAGYGSLRLSLSNRGQDSSQSNADLQVGLTIDENTGGGGKRRRRNAAPIPANSTQMTRDLILSPDEARLLLLDAVNADKPGVNPDQEKEDQEVFDPLLSSSSSPQEEEAIETRVLAQIDEETLGKPRSRQDVDNKAPKSVAGSPTVESTAPTNVSSVLSRKKRQARNPNQYRSPCFVRAEISSNPRVLNLDDTEGELFFFEGKTQRFLRRRCMGQTIVSGSLYQAAEAVRQERTNERAVCKQGYLRRFGLLIMLDPQGEFSFNDGQRFSVQLRPFKLESHCALSVLQ